MEEQCILRAPKDLARRFHKVCLGVEPVDSNNKEEEEKEDRTHHQENPASSSASGTRREQRRQQRQQQQQSLFQLQRIEEPTEDLRQAATQAYQNGNIPASNSSAAAVAADAATRSQDEESSSGAEKKQTRSSVRKDITYTAPEFDYFEVTIQGNEKYNAVLVDLPTLVETHRTNDHKRYYKSGNISKMLYILQPGNTNPSEELTIVDAPMRDNVLNSGLTPPTRHVVKRRFWKAHRLAQGKFSSDQINHAEKMLYEISARKRSEVARWDLIEPPKFMDYWPESMQKFTITYRNGVPQTGKELDCLLRYLLPNYNSVCLARSRTAATDFKPTKPIPPENEDTEPPRPTIDWSEPLHAHSTTATSTAPQQEVDADTAPALPSLSLANNEERDEEDVYMDGEEGQWDEEEENEAFGAAEFEPGSRDEASEQEAISSETPSTTATLPTQPSSGASAHVTETAPILTQGTVAMGEVQASEEATAPAVTTTTHDESATTTSIEAASAVAEEEDPEIKSLNERLQKLQSEIKDLERKKRSAMSNALAKKFDKSIADKNEQLTKVKSSLQERRESRGV